VPGPTLDTGIRCEPVLRGERDVNAMIDCWRRERFTKQIKNIYEWVYVSSTPGVVWCGVVWCGEHGETRDRER
jgi:hypothetical protein